MTFSVESSTGIACSIGLMDTSVIYDINAAQVFLNTEAGGLTVLLHAE